MRVVAVVPELGRRKTCGNRGRLLHDDRGRHIGGKWIDRCRIKIPIAAGGPPPSKAIVMPAMLPMSAAPNLPLIWREVVKVATVKILAVKRGARMIRAMMVMSLRTVAVRISPLVLRLRRSNRHRKCDSQGDSDHPRVKIGSHVTPSNTAN